MNLRLAATLLWLASFASARAAGLDAAAARILEDLQARKPLVAHVIVALADNEHQGIARIPASLGDGDSPRSNLYWGAMYGVKGFMGRSDAWEPVPVTASGDTRVLERVVYRRVLQRDGVTARAYLLAEAWRGRDIADSIVRFLEISRGQHNEVLEVGGQKLATGGGAHLVAFVGHNGLMDFAVPRVGTEASGPPRAAVVLACYSDSYFSPLLRPHAAPLVTTASLMAPEAYVLEAVVSRWFSGAPRGEVIDAAASAYARYQRISNASALRIFHRGP